MKYLKILSWLMSHPGWHSGRDIARRSGTSRCFVYSRLQQLENAGYVEVLIERQNRSVVAVTYRAVVRLVPMDLNTRDDDFELGAIRSARQS